MLTEILQLKGYSYEDVSRAGLAMRAAGVWQENREDLWLGPFPQPGPTLESRGIDLWTYELGDKLGDGSEEAARMVGGRPYLSFCGETGDEIGFGFHLFVVGLRFGVRPVELVDLLSNLVGVDLLNDGLTWEQRQARTAAVGAEALP